MLRAETAQNTFITQNNCIVNNNNQNAGGLNNNNNNNVVCPGGTGTFNNNNNSEPSALLSRVACLPWGAFEISSGSVCRSLHACASL